MTDKIEIDVAYIAPMTLVPRRARTEKAIKVSGTVRVAVPVVGDGDAPVVLRGTVAREGGFVRRLHEGRLVAPLTFGNERVGGEEWLRRELASQARVVGLLFNRQKAPWDTGRAGVPMPAFERVVSDGREAVEAVVARAAAKLVMIDGVPHAAAPEPILVAQRDRRLAGMQVTPKCFGRLEGGRYRPDGHAFRIDGGERFAEFLERNVGVGGYSYGRGAEMPEVTFDVIEPGVLEFREDLHNAWWASMTALAVGGDNLPWSSSRLVEAYADLARMREGLAAGTASPEEVDAKLEAISGMRGDVGRMVMMKNVIAIGRDAIASSVRTHDMGPPVPMDEDDIDALEALGAGFGP